MSRILALSARKAINPEVKSCIYESKRQHVSKQIHSVVLSPVFDAKHASMSELLSSIIVSNCYSDIDQNNTRYPTGTLRHAVSDHVCTCSADMEGCLPAQSVFFKVDIVVFKPETLKHLRYGFQGHTGLHSITNADGILGKDGPKTRGQLVFHLIHS